MIEWAATILTLFGVILNIKRIRECFFVWFFANLGWVVVQYQAGIYGMALCQLVFCITCIWGWVEWGKSA